MPIEGPLIQGADTMICGRIFGLTAETLIDAQDWRRCDTDRRYFKASNGMDKRLTDYSLVGSRHNA